MDELQINSIQYNILNSAYSLPNGFLPLIGGYLIDKYGYKLCLMLILLILFIG